ncbi:MAG: SCO family protein [Bacteroidota bacterium]
MEENTKKKATSNVKKFGILFIILVLPSLIYVLFSTGKHNLSHSLPYYGERQGVKKVMVDGKERIDTLYHTVPPFSFTNCDGRTITDKDLDSCIYVADFFFTTCMGICPKMNSQMRRVQERMANYPKFKLISHTVDPLRDTVEALAAYAERVQADTKNWYFVTGEKKDIYELGVKGYLVATEEDANAEGGFLHSPMLVLVDREKHIRGFYDGTSVVAVDSLIEDIKVLYFEYEARKAGEKYRITKGK